VSVEGAQIYLFVFLAAVAAGTLIGGPVGDRIGRKSVIWGSILGVFLPEVGRPVRPAAIGKPALEARP
jgi:MFS family permease